MTKKTTPQPKRFSCPYPSFFSARLSSIIAIVLLLASISFLYAKNQELERKYEKQNQPTVLQSTTSATPTPTPKPTPTTKPTTNTPSLAPQPKSMPSPVINKVPVVLPHNGLTYYCDPSVAQSVKDASANVQSATARLIECLNQVDGNIKNCVDACKSSLEGCSNEIYRATFGYLSYDDCVSKKTQESTRCIDDCYQNPITSLQRDLCYSAASPYTQSLNDLLDKYCR